MNKRNYLGLASIKGIGYERLIKLITIFAGIDDLTKLDEKKLTELKLPVEFLYSIKNINWREIDLMLSWEKTSINNYLITLMDEKYPQILKHIPDPPMMLFAIGDIKLLEKPSIAIVGSRRASSQGLENSYNFSLALARKGYAIISGLAQGIDTQAHLGALAVHGATIAVMGTGINKVYPYQNRNLAESIKNHGLLLSELPLDSKPMPYNFPKRNRIISGLSLGVLIVEASLKSGSLITARLGLEQGKEIFALPSSVHNPLAKGCHSLIKQGAKLIESIKDIEDEFPIQTQDDLANSEQLIAKGLDTNLQNLVKFIGYETTPLHSIMNSSGLKPPQLNYNLVELELKGLVRSVLGGYMRI